MTEQAGAPAPVTDRRVMPRGVLPRGIQTWLMAGLAVGIVLIVLLTGHPEAPERREAAPAAQQAPNPDRVRDYQERLRVWEARAALEAQAAATQSAPTQTEMFDEPQPSAPEDPLAADRRRREYESLFASNVVLSRRPEALRPDSGGRSAGAALDPMAGGLAGPSIAEIADAVVRATMRAGTPTANPAAVQAPAPPRAGTPEEEKQRGMEGPRRTDPISAAGPLHRVTEGTVIDAVLTNRLDGNSAAPVNCLVTNPVYSHSGQHVLIPAGARILGETRPVQALGETRLAVGFHRLVMPDGQSYGLEQFLGLNQLGDSGLRDRVNQHYWSTFGAAGAVGLITGLAQWLGTAGFGGGSGDRTVIIAGGADATSQASLHPQNPKTP